METDDIKATTEPLDIVSKLSLEAGSTYRVQNQGAEPVRLRQTLSGSPAPIPHTPGFTIRNLENEYIEVESGLAVWVWTERNASKCVVGKIS